jgi:U3 small nucleolar RNA-associated protein 12
MRGSTQTYTFLSHALTSVPTSQVVVATQSNTLEMFTVTETASERTLAVEMPGHRSAVRAVALSKDDTVLVSASSGALINNLFSSVCASDVRQVVLSLSRLHRTHTVTDEAKVWNVATQRCIRTVPTGYGLSVAVVPGGRHALVGTKSGLVQIVDIAAATVLEDIPAHKGSWRE